MRNVCGNLSTRGEFQQPAAAPLPEGLLVRMASSVKLSRNRQRCITAAGRSALRIALAALALGAPAAGVLAADVVSRDAQPVTTSVAATDASSLPRQAAFGAEHAAADVRAVADWVRQARDNEGAPFLIVDKKNARLFVFDPDARLAATAPVLLGAARGDDSVPGIGERRIADIKPYERTTPAGRFVAEAGRNLQGEDIVWIDYDAAVSMHRVRATNPRERRLERLATPTVADNRISYGCINVPVAFFNAYVSPVFAAGKAVVYVLPETRALREVFRSRDGVSPAASLATGERARDVAAAR